jgi:hypothetical protein
MEGCEHRDQRKIGVMGMGKKKIPGRGFTQHSNIPSFQFCLPNIPIFQHSTIPSSTEAV